MRYGSILILPLSLLLLMGCGDDGEITALGEVRNNLTQTWEVETVFLDGFDVTDPSYTNFAILFREDGSYFAVDAEPVFTTSGGFWTFIDDDPRRLRIGDIEAIINLNEDATALNIQFTAEGEPIGQSGRVRGLSGDYEFDLVVSDQVLE